MDDDEIVRLAKFQFWQVKPATHLKKTIRASVATSTASDLDKLVIMLAREDQTKKILERLQRHMKSRERLAKDGYNLKYNLGRAVGIGECIRIIRRSGERSRVGGCDTCHALQQGNLKAETTPAKGRNGERGLISGKCGAGVDVAPPTTSAKDLLFRLDWIKILQRAIAIRPEAWRPRGKTTYKPAEWKNASDTLMHALLEEVDEQ